MAILEAELKAANDKIEQITHELAKKTELIQVRKHLFLKHKDPLNT